MAGTSGKTPHSVIDELEKRPHAFDFFRAVRLLQSEYPNHSLIGYSLSPAQDPIRFAQNPSLAFAPSTLEALRPGPAGSTPRLYVNFFGLFGPNGPLPIHITEYARERQLHVGDNTITAFFNAFHHRLISFFYRAWAANQKAVDLDRYQNWRAHRKQEKADWASEPRFARYIGSLFGIGLESLQERDEVQDWAKLYFAGHLSNQVRNAEGLEAILQEYFGIRVEVQTFAGRWLDLPLDCLCKLGDSPETGSLGLNAIIGSRFWEAQLNFRIRLGPMNLLDYERLLPSGTAFKRLKCWVLNYCGEQFLWDVQFVLLAKEVPNTCLGKSGRLGWTTWLKAKPFTQDADDLILNPPRD